MIDVRATFDRFDVRVVLAVVIGLPVSLLAALAIPVSFFLGIGGFIAGSLGVAGLVPNAGLSMLGVAGLWLRIIRTTQAMSETARSYTRRLLGCGVAAAVYWACFGVSGLGLKNGVAVFCWVLAAIGAILIHATPKPSNRSSALLLVAASGFAMAAVVYALVPRLNAPPESMPAYVTTAAVEARYGRYLDQIESPERAGTEDDVSLRHALERDPAVLQLVRRRGPDIVFEYTRDARSLEYSCSGVGPSAEAGFSRCNVRDGTSVLGRDAILYRRGSDSDGVELILDFDTANALFRRDS